jgi:hypothetical protein
MAKNRQEGTIMLQIKQFPYGEDNLGYLIYGGKQAMAIDGGYGIGTLGIAVIPDVKTSWS